MPAYQWSQSKEGIIACPLCNPPDFCSLQAGMGLGQWYLAIDFFARLSPNLARNCTEGRGKKAIIVKFFCLPRGWREAVTPWPCVHRGMAQVIFQGLEGARHKADNWIISLTISKAEGGQFFTWEGLPLRNTPKHTQGKVQKHTQEKSSKAHTGRRSQHHARWKLPVRRCLIWKYVRVNSNWMKIFGLLAHWLLVDYNLILGIHWISVPQLNWGKLESYLQSGYCP